jgi:ubiquinone/menaquinone biosynthesis C-methylase UbiE
MPPVAQDRDLARATERQQRVWDRLAPRYDRSMGLVEKLFVGDGRIWICSQAVGDVLEVAIGTGRNLPFYPDGVRLTGIDHSPEILALARQRAGELGLQASLRRGDAQALPFPDESFDTVVCMLSLCAIPNDRKAVAEMKRVLRPSGKLLLLDHVRATSPVAYAIQWLIEQVSLRLEGEHQLRRPFEHVLAEGFEIERHDRLKRGIIERLAARKPRG